MIWFVGLACFNAGWIGSRLAGHVSRRWKSGMTMREAIKPTRGDRRTPRKVTEVA